MNESYKNKIMPDTVDYLMNNSDINPKKSTGKFFKFVDLFNKVCYDLLIILLIMATNIKGIAKYAADNISHIVFGSSYYITLFLIIITIGLYLIGRFTFQKKGICIILNNLLLAAAMLGISQAGISSFMENSLGLVFIIAFLFVIISFLKTNISKYIFLFIHTFLCYIYHTIYLTRGVNILPKEILLWRTAAEVAGNYTIKWFDRCYVFAVMYIVFAILVINRSYIYESMPIKCRFKISLTTYKLSQIIGSVVASIFFVILYFTKFNIWHYRYNVADTGIISTFLLLLTLNTANKPPDYNKLFYTLEYQEEYSQSGKIGDVTI